MSETGTHSDDAIQTWKEKLAGFEKELAICADAPRKFELKKRIEECNGEIARLEAAAITGSKGQVDKSSTKPPPWNVPFSKNPFFTGREKVLADVEKELHASGQVALTGLGGVGKTQIAAHFPHEHRDEYSAVLWANAASQEALVSDFAAIASLLNLPERDEKDQALAVAAVKRWLDANRGWLLILDNANDLATVRRFIPQLAKGHVLLTTQAQATGDIQAIEVRDMLPEDGALLLLRRTKILKTDVPLSAAADPARDSATGISKELGGLPLALDQAGAYIEETGCGVAGYLDLYRQRRADLLKRRGGFGPDHPESVATTVALSFERVACASHAAADLLRFCAFLQPDAIPEEIFANGERGLGPNLGPVAADPLNLNTACAEILKYSLFRRHAGAKTLGIHRLVQEVIQDGLTKEEKYLWAERAVRAVNSAFPAVEFPDMARCERMISQALVCTLLIDAYGFESKEAARLLNQAGYYLYARARFSEAEPLYKSAAKIWEKVSDPEVATAANNLALVYFAQGKYSEAEVQFNRSLVIRSNTIGENHPAFPKALVNLAALHETQGRYPEAEAGYLRAIDNYKRGLGRVNLELATAWNNLGALYYRQRMYQKAEQLYKQSLAMQEMFVEANHPVLSNNLNNLGELYRSTGRYTEAETLLERALKIAKTHYGNEHPNVAYCTMNLAMLYEDQGRYANAEQLCQEAIALLQEVSGSQHPNLATFLDNYAFLLRKLSRADQAAMLEGRAQAIRAANAENKPPK
jgi:tetratricopeptide (TPR) repeat protein